MFSSALKLSNKNDFLAPAPECICFLNNIKGIVNLTEKGTKISIKDCLACSGCITTAETVLIEEKSIDYFCDLLKKNKFIVVSISEQTIAAFSE